MALSVLKCFYKKLLNNMFNFCLAVNSEMQIVYALITLIIGSVGHVCQLYLQYG